MRFNFFKRKKHDNAMLRSHYIQHRCDSCRFRDRRYHEYPCTQGDYELRRGRDCTYWKPRFLGWFLMRGKG